jgi:hypothetical protein
MELPDSIHVQCPACGAPTTETELGRTPDDAGYGLLLSPCGHLVTLELIRDAWGIEIPEPNPTRVAYPTPLE